MEGVDVYAAWKADKDLPLAQQTEGARSYTDQYLKDRAAYLGWMSTANLGNLPETAGKTVIDGSKYGYQDVRNWEFTNLNSTPSLSQTYFVQGSIIGGTNKIIFGANGNEGGDKPLQGALGDDRLYGLAGNDQLDGGKGADWLEGGTGNDTLKGGEGADTLLGGDGQDILEGGKGSDSLAGGKGNDSYLIKAGDGWDWIEDQDGAGHIELGGVTIGDAAGPITCKAPNVWQQSIAGKDYWYILTDWTEGTQTFPCLILQGPDGDGVRIKGWSNGNLGINLPGNTPAAPPATGGTIVGTDADDMQLLPKTTYVDGVPTSVLVSWPTLECTGGNDLVQGLGGSDHLCGGWKSDILEGGAGTDILEADPGMWKHWEGTPYWDADAAASGNDDLYGDTRVDLATLPSYENFGGATASGQKGDWLAGGWGQDRLVGSAGNDMLFGGAGTDLFLAGAGNDYLLGDRDWLPVDFDWSVTHNAQEPFLSFITIRNELDYEADPIRYGKADILYGGQGNDWMLGGQGNDLVYGESGADTAIGGDGDDRMFGGESGDFMTGDEAYNGDEDPRVRRGNDLLDGGDGNDWLQGDLGNDTLLGGAGDDELFGDNIRILTSTPAAPDPALPGGVQAMNDSMWSDAA